MLVKISLMVTLFYLSYCSFKNTLNQSNIFLMNTEIIFFFPFLKYIYYKINNTFYIISLKINLDMMLDILIIN